MLRNKMLRNKKRMSFIEEIKAEKKYWEDVILPKRKIKLNKK